MKPLQRLLRTLTAQDSLIKNPMTKEVGEVKNINVFQSQNFQFSQVLNIPECIKVRLQMKPEYVSENIIFRNFDDEGNMQEIAFYDSQNVVFEMRDIAKHARLKSLKFYCLGIDWGNSDLPLHIQSPPGQPLFQKNFAFQEEKVLQRICRKFGATQLQKPSGLREYHQNTLEIIPYGGYFTFGCDIDEVFNYFVQPIFNEAGQLIFQMTGARFWQEKGIQPFRGSELLGYQIVCAGFQGQSSSVLSLAEDIRTGQFLLEVFLDQQMLGSWISQSFQYVDRPQGILEVNFVA